MSVETPDNTSQVEDRIKADVQREAPDSNPYINTHWLRSLIAGFARRIFDFQKDLDRTELRVMPDTADDNTAPRWGKIYVGSENQATIATGNAVATGVAGSLISIGEILQSNGLDYASLTSATIANNTINVDSITRNGSIATCITAGMHKLSSFVPVTIAGADQSEYNVTDVEIVVTGMDSFTYSVDGTPAPATGTIIAAYTSACIELYSVGFGTENNLDLDSPLQLQSPIPGIDDTLYVSFATVGGGSDEETTIDYKARYLDKIRNPVSHFNGADITAKAKETTGVTRVFVQNAGDEIGTVGVISITHSGQVATATTATPHGFEDGFQTTITGANQEEYNVIKARIIIQSSTIFNYIISGSPVAATGTITATTIIPLGTVRTYFMRDNDANSIPSAAEVDIVKASIATILPANVSSTDNLVVAPIAVPVDYAFTELEPNTSTMRESIASNIQQFHDEQTTVSVNVDEDAYRAAIKNTVDLETGLIVKSFELSTPVGDIVIASGEIATKGLVTFNIV
ncbi:MAG: hypothetical protein DRQ35_01190 [Gammaproteobacteria bacterium]|nr:MAG: hypothetical protein DRQ35_01190 [Gammaproteobacteria bacterium]